MQPRGLALAGASCAAIATVLVLVRRHRRISFSSRWPFVTVGAARVEWWRLSATEVVNALQTKQVSATELVDCAIERIQQSDADVNAVIRLRVDAARARAAAIDAVPLGDAPGPLFGLPVLIKECHSIEGESCTHGSPVWRERVASSTNPIVRAIEAAGGIVLGVTNQPEHAAGSHTFNPVYGTTSNPHNLSKSAGGSSGGSTAALATGAAWLATGTDLGGSLRNPAAFCGVVGLRTSPGRVAMPTPGGGEWRGRWGLGLHSVSGPLARTVADAALLLDALTPALPPSASMQDSFESLHVAEGWEAFAMADLPPPPPGGYLAHVRDARAHAPRAVAWSVNLGGVLQAVDPAIAAVVQRAARLLASASGGALLQQAAPKNLGHAHSIFMTLRHSRLVDGVAGGPDATAVWLSEHGAATKPEVVWELQRGVANGWKARVAAAEHGRQEIERSFLLFFDAFDVLVCPCTLMPSFGKELRYPSKCALPAAATGGRAGGSWALSDYVEWMLPCTVVSLANLPAMSVPVGTARDGTPLGVQLVGKPGGEAALLAAAALLEAEIGAVGGAPRVPVDPVHVRPPPPSVEHDECASGQEWRWTGPRSAEEATAHLALAPKILP